MQTQANCIQCLVKQSIRTAGILTTDSEEIECFIVHIKKKLDTINRRLPPPVHGGMIHQETEVWFGVTDPFKKHKEFHIQQAKFLIPEMRKIIKDSHDPLLTAVKLAIGGNAIDFGVDRPFHLVADLKNSLHQPLAINHYRAFKQKLGPAKHILYIGDNAGESVLDRLLIETINKPVYFATRNCPAINDVTLDDARNSGLSDVATIISSGSNIPGTIPEFCNEEFREHLIKADLIISKGQGNYETLSEVKLPIFFLLKIKCPVVANDLEVPEGRFVLKSTLN